MKKITLLMLFISTITFAQKRILFKDSTSVITNKIKIWKGQLVYEDSLGVVVRVKKKNLLFVKDVSLAKDKFEYNQLGLTDFIVTKTEDLSQKDLFNKSINWIKETYKNPDEVIKTTINPQKIRFQGFQDNVICVSALGSTSCYGVTYTIVLSFKDGKYKFDPIELTYRVPYSKYNPGGTFPISFYNGLPYYNSKGLLRKSYNTIPSSVEHLFNSLNKSLNDYVKSSKDVVSKDNDW